MRKHIGFICALICILLLAGCNGRGATAIPEDAPTISGIVQEVRDHSILLSLNSGAYPYGTECIVSLDVECPDGNPDLSVGDEVVVRYSGTIAESSPLQLDTVYAVTLRIPAKETAKWDKIPMVMVDGKLYYDTGKESSIDGRCGVMDGEITSTVDSSETPTVNDQSNFGVGFGYQYGAEDTIEIWMNEKWIVFEHRTGDGSQVRFADRWIDRDSLSDETLEWLDWYNSLSEQEQRAISAIPADLLDASEISDTEDAEAASN